MKCKNCPSTEALIDNDPLYSSYLCLQCGYSYREEGMNESEIDAYCLLIVEDRIYQPMVSRKDLLHSLRIYRSGALPLEVKLRKYIAGEFREKAFMV